MFFNKSKLKVYFKETTIMFSNKYPLKLYELN